MHAFKDCNLFADKVLNYSNDVVISVVYLILFLVIYLNIEKKIALYSLMYAKKPKQQSPE